MKEQIEPRSPKGTSSSIWAAPRFKPEKKNWSFLNKTKRGSLPKLKTLIHKGKGTYKLGPYEGDLPDLKKLAAMRGDIQYLKIGCVNIKV